MSHKDLPQGENVPYNDPPRQSEQNDPITQLMGAVEGVRAQVEKLTRVVYEAVESPAHRRDRIATALLSALLINTESTNLVRDATARAIELIAHLDSLNNNHNHGGGK